MCMLLNWSLCTRNTHTQCWYHAMSIIMPMSFGITNFELKPFIPFCMSLLLSLFLPLSPPFVSIPLNLTDLVCIQKHASIYSNVWCANMVYRQNRNGHHLQIYSFMVWQTSVAWSYTHTPWYAIAISDCTISSIFSNFITSN